MKLLTFLLSFALLSCDMDLRMPDDFDFVVDYNGNSQWHTQDSTFTHNEGGKITKITISLTKEERKKIWDALVKNEFVGIPEEFNCEATNLPATTTRLTVYHAKKVKSFTRTSNCIGKEKRERQELDNILATIEGVLTSKTAYKTSQK